MNDYIVYVTVNVTVVVDVRAASKEDAYAEAIRQVEAAPPDGFGSIEGARVERRRHAAPFARKR